MLTEVLPVNQQNIARAAALLREGAVVAFPTETVYGLGANGLDADAVARIYEAKGRPHDNPMILHVAEKSGFAPLVRNVPKQAELLADAFWPGPLTIVLESADFIPLITRGGLTTVAVRCPSDPWARALIAQCGFPLAAPSANLSGKPSPTTPAAVFEDMDGRIPLILDGGACSVGLESTVITLCTGTPRVLRPGGITPEQIAAVIGAVDVDGSALHELEAGAQAGSPGMKYRHYAPKAAVTIVGGQPCAAADRICALYDEAELAGRNPAVLAMAQDTGRFGSRNVYDLGMGGNIESVGSALYDTLRQLDADGRTDVFAEAVEPEGFGLAVMNRLLRAAGFHFIQA